MTTARSPSRRSKIKLAVLAVTPLLSLGAIEMVFRYRAWELNRDSLESFYEVPPEVGAINRTRFFDLIRPHSNDRLIYELRPDLAVEYAGQPVTTNAAGFRCPDVPLEAEPGTITIVGIGASIMFGHGVGDDENFLAVLEQALRRHHPSRGWRAINTAVPSYNVVMKVETLKLKGLAYRPDLVILGVASNNLDLPNYVRIDEDPLDLGRSFLLDFLGERRSIEAATARRDSVLAAVNKEKLSWCAEVATAPEKIPERYRGLVGWEPFNRALDELAQLSAEHGFEVLVVANLEVDLAAQMLDEARRRGFHAFSVMEELEAYIKKLYQEDFTLERYCKSPLVASEANLHPSALQHRMMAWRIRQEMLRTGLVDRLMANVPPADASPSAASSGR